MNESEILTAIKNLEKRVDSLEMTVNHVTLDQKVINDSVRRMQMDFLTVNEWLQKVITQQRQNSST